jgi:hopanoid biosynthesis associated protein HpnK
MVSAPSVEDAINRAKSLPDLKVGLHLVLSNGKSTLPASEIPALVDSESNFESNQVNSGIKMFFNAAAKYQLEKEIRAQFEAFKATGLMLDHVNAHNHMHMHPTVFDLILTIGSEYGLTAIRLPNEKPLESIIEDGKDKFKRNAQYFFLKPFISSMKKKCDVRDIKYNETIYGLHDSGHMNIDKLIRILPHIEEGVTEIYLHPATERWDDIDPAANDYEFEAEYKALIHARIKRAIEKFDIQLSGFNS